MQTKQQVVDALNEITGGLSQTTKMPESSFSTPAKHCKVGSKLREVEGSVCEKCYAMKGNYNYPNVMKAQQRRYERLNHPLWVQAMTMLIYIKVKKRFRWFDSGDIDSLQQLRNIIDVCNGTPNVQHWLVTKEKRTVRKFLDDGGVIPDNLVIQMSGYMVNGDKVKGFDDCKQITHHLVHSDIDKAQGHICPVEDGKGFSSCEEANCFACWDRSVNVVTSGLH
jgi:hypothetical protein